MGSVGMHQDVFFNAKMYYIFLIGIAHTFIPPPTPNLGQGLET
jgi:hypothetical protein